jgi:hypothetical protein
MPTYAVQLVYRGVLEEPGGGDPARLEIIVLGTEHPADDKQVEALATEYARKQELQRIELPQGPGMLRFAGIRALDEVQIPAPASPTVVASFNLEPDAGQFHALLAGGFVRAVFDW